MADVVDRVLRRRGGSSPGSWRRGSAGRLGPRGVRRKDERGDATRRAEGGGHRFGGVGGHVVGPRRAAVPARDGPGDGRDVGLERRVVLAVVRGMVADHVHHRRAGSPRVVQVGQPVPQTRSEVQQGGRGTPCHSGVPVSCARRHALEEAEHRPHGRHIVERGHEMHFGGAGIGEADVDTRADESREHGTGAVHGRTVPDASAVPGIRPGPRIPRGSKAALMDAHQRQLRRIDRSRRSTTSSPSRCRAHPRWRLRPRPPSGRSHGSGCGASRRRAGTRPGGRCRRRHGRTRSRRSRATPPARRPPPGSRGWQLEGSRRR